MFRMLVACVAGALSLIRRIWSYRWALQRGKILPLVFLSPPTGLYSARCGRPRNPFRRQLSLFGIAVARARNAEIGAFGIRGQNACDRGIHSMRLGWKNSKPWRSPATSPKARHLICFLFPLEPEQMENAPEKYSTTLVCLALEIGYGISSTSHTGWH